MAHNTTNAQVWGRACVIVLAVLGVTRIGDLVAPSQANAEMSLVDPETKTPFNASGQRREMINELKALSVRMTAIEKMLKTGISVKVTEMPEITVEMPKD